MNSDEKIAKLAGMIRGAMMGEALPILPMESMLINAGRLA